MILHKIRKLSLWQQGALNGLILSFLIECPFLAHRLYQAAVDYLETLYPKDDSDTCLLTGEMIRHYEEFVILPVLLCLGVALVCWLVQKSSLMLLKSKVLLWQIIGFIWCLTLPWWTSLLYFVSLIFRRCVSVTANEIDCENVVFAFNVQLTWADFNYFPLALGIILPFNLIFALIFCRRRATFN